MWALGTQFQNGISQQAGFTQSLVYSTWVLCFSDWKDIEGFTWEEYLATMKVSPVPARAFKNVSS